MSAARIATAAAVLVVAVALTGCGRLTAADPVTGAPAAGPSATSAGTDVSLDDVVGLLDEAEGSLDDTEQLLDDADDAASQETRR